MTKEPLYIDTGLSNHKFSRWSVHY